MALVILLFFVGTDDRQCSRVGFRLVGVEGIVSEVTAPTVAKRARPRLFAPNRASNQGLVGLILQEGVVASDK
jgi:hypothetical protein